MLYEVTRVSPGVAAVSHPFFAHPRPELRRAPPSSLQTTAECPGRSRDFGGIRPNVASAVPRSAKSASKIRRDGRAPKVATVLHREMKTGISEASKRVSIFSFATQRQASEFLFSTEKLGPSPRGSDPVSCRLT